MKRFALLVVIVFSFACSENPEDRLFSFDGYTMGTTYSVKILKDSGSKIQYEMLQEGVEEVLAEVNRQMSTYIETSEISQFNQSKAGELFSVSDELVEVIDKALWLSKESDGAYDITIGPLVNLWGFGPEMKVSEVPSDREIEKMRNLVGFNKLHVDLSEKTLLKDNDSIYCEPASIAKGFGVDEVGRYLETKNVKNYLVEIGGEIRTRGINHKNKTWAIGISSPDAAVGIQSAISLKNLSMATSGDYRNYFEEDGVRYSHLIDPRTGKPITHNLASVTVLHGDCAIADAVATAINVMGSEEGFKLAEKLDVPIYMILRVENTFEERMNSSFEELIIKRN